MPQYRYQVRQASGQIQAGVLSADTAATAAATLRSQGAGSLNGVIADGLHRAISELHRLL